jgi:FMN phosphatase YigB (HAD superfamily)
MAGSAGGEITAVLNASDVVFLLDVDNTLLDNDRFQVDLGDRLEQSFGAFEKARYWSIIARRREEIGLVDYLGSLQEFRAGLDDHAELLEMSEFLLEYPFAERLFRRSLDTVAHLETFGRPVVLSDGDIVFQPRKIQRSGIWSAVEGRVLIYVHKEKVLDHVQRRFPAKHYVMVDDKSNLLAAMKLSMGPRLTTVFVRQGHYAEDPQSNLVQPAPDMVIERIEDLIPLKLTDFKVPL